MKDKMFYVAAWRVTTDFLDDTGGREGEGERKEWLYKCTRRRIVTTTKREEKWTYELLTMIDGE